MKAESNNTGHTSVVVGLGKTGLACARYLAALGDRVIVTDTRERPPGLEELNRLLPDTETRLGGFDEGVLNLADRLIVSPGVSLREPFIAAAIRRNVMVTGDIELFVNAVQKPILAVTGSNGKSTVTCLLGAMICDAGFQVSVGGNIGVPALELLAAQEPDYYVLELSSFQLERTQSLFSAVATILNISPDHIDHHGNMTTYLAAKSRIYEHCEVAVYNRDDAAVSAMLPNAQNSISFGLDAPSAGHYGLIEYEAAEWLACGTQRLLPVSALHVYGHHNVANVLAALAMGDAIGLPRESMLETAQAFRGLPHRSQWVSDARGLIWINDSKGTNVGATVAAIDAVRTPVVLIAGGDGKGADFTPLARSLKTKARGAVLLGKDARLLDALLSEVCPTTRVNDMVEAVTAAVRLAHTGDTILLSPACSSLDMYANYEARGDAFVAAIQRCAA